jgi:hypothetical protein
MMKTQRFPSFSEPTATYTMMKSTPIVSLIVLFIITLAGCSTPQFDQSMKITFKTVDVTATKTGNVTVLGASTVVSFSNRTEKALNIAIEEGTFLDNDGKKSLLRFRPIVPESYGSFASIQLLPMQVKEVTIVTPPDMEPFDLTKHTNVRIKYNITTSEGYRTEVISAAYPIQNK